MSRPKYKKTEAPLPLHTRLRILGHKLGVAEMYDWYGEPKRFEGMRKAHAQMLRQLYYKGK